MIHQIRNSIYIKILWGFLGCYFLNLSIDAPDLNPAYVPENLSYNDQESILELVVEKVLGYENAIEEYDDNDTEDHNLQNKVKIDLMVNFPTDSATSQLAFRTTKHSFSDFEDHLMNGFCQLDFPPPRI